MPKKPIISAAPLMPAPDWCLDPGIVGKSEHPVAREKTKPTVSSGFDWKGMTQASPLEVPKAPPRFAREKPSTRVKLSRRSRIWKLALVAAFVAAATLGTLTALAPRNETSTEVASPQRFIPVVATAPAAVKPKVTAPKPVATKHVEAPTPAIEQFSKAEIPEQRRDNPAQAEQERQEKQFTNATKRATALIVTPGGGGTGFLVKKCILATNVHVIADDGGQITDKHVERCSAMFFAPGKDMGKKLRVTVLYADATQDLALLKVATEREPLALSDGEEVVEDLPVAVVGNPRSEFSAPDFPAQDINKVTTGKFLQAILNRRTRLVEYEIDATIAPGNSGGPVISLKSGKVIGVATHGLGNLATGAILQKFCMPASLLEDALRDADRGVDWRKTAARTGALRACREALSALQSVGDSANRIADAKEIEARGGVPRLSEGSRSQATGANVTAALRSRIETAFTGAKPHIKAVKDCGLLCDDARDLALKLTILCDKTEAILQEADKDNNKAAAARQLRHWSKEFAGMYAKLEAKLERLEGAN